MNRTGSGLDGFKYTSFQEYIVREVCKYYFILDPVLKDRPNVRAWFTNEDETMNNDKRIQQKDNTVLLSSDDDSTLLTSDKSFRRNNRNEVEDKIEIGVLPKRGILNSTSLAITIVSIKTSAVVKMSMVMFLPQIHILQCQHQINHLISQTCLTIIIVLLHVLL